MRRELFIGWIFVLILTLSGCSLDLSRITPPTNSNQTTNIPVIWKGLGLKGKLVYIHSKIGSITGGISLKMSILSLDLSDGNVQTIFQAPDGAWIDFATVSPDGNQVVMAYLPSPVNPSDLSAPRQQALYTLLLDRTNSPQLLFPPPSMSDQYFQPVWSGDGKYIYFSHADSRVQISASQPYVAYDVYRMAYPDGRLEKLVEHAYWPRLSEDGTQLVYVSVDPVTGSNQLELANSDGTNPRSLAFIGSAPPSIIDAPIFTPDNKSIVYSAPSPIRSYIPNWFDNEFGIIGASAHIVPSDWWKVSTAGGTPEQLTHLSAIGLFASLSPDQNYFVSYSDQGIFLMNLDGTQLTSLVNDTNGAPGTVSWIP